MFERIGTRPGSISPLQLFTLVTIASAIFLNTAPYIGLLTNTPKSDKPATIAEVPPASDKPAARVVARAEVQTTKPESVTGRAWIQPRDASPPFEKATAAESAPSPKKEKSMTAEALPVPHSAPKQGSARPTFTTPPLPVPASKQTRSAISRSEAPPLPTRAPKEVRPRIAESALQQTGRASWYSLDSPTANGENMDDAALTAARRA